MLPPHICLPWVLLPPALPLFPGFGGDIPHLAFLLCPQGGVVTTPGPGKGGNSGHNTPPCAMSSPTLPSYLGIFSFFTLQRLWGDTVKAGTKGSLHENGGKLFFREIKEKKCLPRISLQFLPSPPIFFSCFLVAEV